MDFKIIFLNYSSPIRLPKIGYWRGFPKDCRSSKTWILKELSKSSRSPTTQKFQRNKDPFKSNQGPVKTGFFKGIWVV